MSEEIPVEWLPGDKITADKLNAMQRYLYALEGDYTSYKYVWSRDYSATLSSKAYILKVSNVGTVIFTELTDESIVLKRNYAGVESTLGSDFDTDGGYRGSSEAISFKMACSVLQTYYVLADYSGAGTEAKIYKNDALIQTITVTDDDANVLDIYAQIVMSPNGRYFALVTTTSGADAGETIMLYEADV